MREVQVPADEETVRRVAGQIESVTFRRYTVSSRVLLSPRLFSAWDTDVDVTRIIPSSEKTEETRYPLPMAVLLAREDLLIPHLQRLKEARSDRPDRVSPRAMTLHCAGCDARWLFDGNHGLLRIGVRGEDVGVEVTEMSSVDWGGLHRACRC